MAKYQLHHKLFIQGRIVTLSGLLIGGSDTALSIGGIDKTVIRDPKDGRPYIPGSSLKGKLRAMTELRHGTLGNQSMGAVKNGPCSDENSRAVKLFGNAVNSPRNKGGKTDTSDPQRPSSLIVRDGYLIPGQDFPYADLGWTHTKTEAVIDRITARATPRTFERVPPNAAFGLHLVLNIFQEGEEDIEKKAKDLMQDLFTAMMLLQDDYLGGQGSRGSGQVCFEIESILRRDMDWYQGFEAGQEDKGADCREQYPQFFASFPCKTAQP